MSDIDVMRPGELLRRLRRLAVRRELDFEISEGRNHTKVSLDGRRAVVPRHASDLKTGTLQAILKQLGLRSEDVER